MDAGRKTRALFYTLLLLLSILLASFSSSVNAASRDFESALTQERNDSLPSTSTSQNDSPYTCSDFNFKTFVRSLQDHDPSEKLTLTLPTPIDRICYCEVMGARDPEYEGLKISTCETKCAPCDVHYPRCQIQNICCPYAKNLQTTPSSTAVATNTYSNSHTKNVCIELQREKLFLLARSCPDDYADHVTRTLCEDDVPIDNVTMATATAVTDETNGVVYYNKYCAECNGLNLTQITPWTPVIYCQSTRYLLEAQTKTEFFKLSNQENTGCYLHQFDMNIETDLLPIRCDQFDTMEEDEVISSCNTTGLEMSSLGIEDKLCDEAPGIADFRVKHGLVVYKNIYCLMCNMEIAKNQRRWDCYERTSSDRAPFTFFFGFNDDGFNQGGEGSADNNLDRNTCQSDEWMDPQGNCRKLLCSAGKTFQGNHCETVLADEIKGLPYRTELLFVPEAHFFNASANTTREITMEEVTASLADTVANVGWFMFKALEIHMAVLFGNETVEKPASSNDDKQQQPQQQQPRHAHPQVFSMPQFVWMTMYTTSSEFIPRDLIEEKFLEGFNDSIVVPTGASYSTSYKVQFAHDRSDIDPSCDIMLVNTTATTSCHSSLYYYYYVDEVIGVQSRSRSFVDVFTVPKSSFVHLVPYLTCPHVELSGEEVQETTQALPVSRFTKIALRFQDLRFQLTDPALISQVYPGKDGMFYVCRDVLNAVIHQDMISDPDGNLWIKIQYVLTIVCVSASLFCLLATVVTFCMFPSLRNVAGCNTLGLSSSLMIAQILLFVANGLDGPGTVCTAVGVITHYAWLVMFTWTFLCCLNILKVFARLRATNRSNPSQDRKAIASNVITSFLAPALIVGVIMGTYLVSYEGKRLGYGNKSCAMDSPFAINGPLIFVISCNIIFFVVVICKIWSVRRMKDKMDIGKEDRKDFVVYVKLSTLTGMFWLLVFLGEVLANDIIRCFAIILNGCQGMFIFASFIVNRRILKLYLQKFDKE